MVKCAIITTIVVSRESEQDSQNFQLVASLLCDALGEIHKIFSSNHKVEQKLKVNHAKSIVQSMLDARPSPQIKIESM